MRPISTLFMEGMLITVTFIFHSLILVMMTTARFNPGPGAYEPKTSIAPTGEYFVSTIKNSCAPHFSLPKVAKPNEIKKTSSPGPGSYAIKTGISDPNATFISTIKGPKTRTFYHCDRRTIDIPKYVQCNY